MCLYSLIFAPRQFQYETHCWSTWPVLCAPLCICRTPAAALPAQTDVAAAAVTQAWVSWQASERSKQVICGCWQAGPRPGSTPGSCNTSQAHHPCTHPLLRLALGCHPCQCRILGIGASVQGCKLSLLGSTACLQLSKSGCSGSIRPRCTLCSCRCRGEVLRQRRLCGVQLLLVSACLTLGSRQLASQVRHIRPQVAGLRHHILPRNHQLQAKVVALLLQTFHPGPTAGSGRTKLPSLWSSGFKRVPRPGAPRNAKQRTRGAGSRPGAAHWRTARAPELVPLMFKLLHVLRCLCQHGRQRHGTGLRWRRPTLWPSATAGRHCRQGQGAAPHALCGLQSILRCLPVSLPRRHLKSARLQRCGSSLRPPAHEVL